MMGFLKANKRFQEFIRYSCLIRFPHGLQDVAGTDTYSFHHSIISLLYPFPPFVAVHSVIPACYRGQMATGYFHMVQQLLYETYTRMRIAVPSVCKRMYKGLVGNAVFKGCGKQTFQMVDMGMDASVCAKPYKMYVFVIFVGILECFGNYVFLAKGGIFNCHIQSHQILVNHPAGAKIHVAHF